MTTKMTFFIILSCNTFEIKHLISMIPTTVFLPTQTKIIFVSFLVVLYVDETGKQNKLKMCFHRLLTQSISTFDVCKPLQSADWAE